MFGQKKSALKVLLPGSFIVMVLLLIAIVYMVSGVFGDGGINKWFAKAELDQPFTVYFNDKPRLISQTTEISVTTSLPADSVKFQLEGPKENVYTLAGAQIGKNVYAFTVYPEKYEDGLYQISVAAYSTTADGVARKATDSFWFDINTDPICEKFTYSEWSDCIDGWQTRKILDRLPLGCQGGNPEDLERECIVYDCKTDVWSCSSWTECSEAGLQTRDCKLIDDCPLVDEPQPPIEQKCDYQAPICEKFEYTDWTDCLDNKQQRKVQAAYPEGCQGGSPILTQDCDSCQSDTWICTDWSACGDLGAQTRDCKLSYDCPNADDPMPATKQTCVRDKLACEKFELSDWSNCLSGKQYRRIINKYPENCIADNNEPLYRSCEIKEPALQVEDDLANDLPEEKEPLPAAEEQKADEEPKTELKADDDPLADLRNGLEIEKECTDEWRCDQWSDCENSYQSRSCRLIYDCAVDDSLRPATRRQCQTGEAEVDFMNIDSDTESVRSKDDLTDNLENAAKTLASDLGVDLEDNVLSSTEDQSANVPSECAKINITNQADCELYQQSDKIIEDCRERGYENKSQCRDMMKQEYGWPERCATETQVACSRFVNNVILAGFEPAPIIQSAKTDMEKLKNKSVIISSSDDRVVVEDRRAQTEQDARTESDHLAKVLPMTLGRGSVRATILPSASTEGSGINAVILLDDDGDGLSNDMEKRIGTDPDNPDSDGDGYDDKTEIMSGNDPLSEAKFERKLAPVEKIIAAGAPLQTPKESKLTPAVDMSVEAVVNVAAEESNALRLRGRAAANRVVSIFVYSKVPIVMTSETDENGNWVYDLDRELVDGKHEVYVAINDDSGRIESKSNPVSFFVREARAVSMDEYIEEDVSNIAPDNTQSMLLFYITTGLALMLFVLVGFMVYRKYIYR